MKYYKISRSLNLKEIGVYDQSISCIKYWDLSDVLNIDGTLKEGFPLPHIKLENKAKQSTFINAVNIGSNNFLAFKNYFIDHIKQFNIGEFKTWNIEMTHNGKIITDYCLFRLINSMEANVIDFNHSQFCIGKPFTKENRKQVELKSYHEYINIRLLLREENTRKQLLPEKLVLDFSNLKKDIIRISNLTSLIGGYLVSERFKNAYEENRFTGIDFKEVEAIDKRIEVKF